MSSSNMARCVLAVVVLVLRVSESAKLPAYITPCNRNDPNLNECAVRNGQLALPELLKGDKAFKMPSLLPLKISHISFDAGNNLRISLSNAEIFGFEETRIRDAVMDIEHQHLTFVVYIPRANLIGEYEIKGRILILPIQGKGPANITFVGGTYTYDMDYELQGPEGERKVVVTGSSIKYTTQRAYYRLDNLFNGDGVLGEEMNKFLDENWKEVSKDIGPALSETISQIITNILTAILNKVSYEDFYTE